jgi:hypothetical protein
MATTPKKGKAHTGTLDSFLVAAWTSVGSLASYLRAACVAQGLVLTTTGANVVHGASVGAGVTTTGANVVHGAPVGAGVGAGVGATVGAGVVVMVVAGVVVMVVAGVVVMVVAGVVVMVVMTGGGVVVTVVGIGTQHSCSEQSGSPAFPHWMTARVSGSGTM